MSAPPQPQVDERLFFALWPGEDVRSRLGGVARECAEQVGGRRVPDENLHLTLVFLGAVSAAQARAARELVDALGFAPFALSLDEVGFWSRTRIVWVGSSTLPDALTQLLERLNAGVAALGQAPERRRFAAHVTLIRRARRRPRLRVEPIAWAVSDLCLVRSELGAAGARYEVVARSPRP